MSTKRVLIFSKRGESKADQAKKELLNWLKKEKIEAVDFTSTEKTIPDTELKNVVLGVVIGGDGTFLTLVRNLQSKDRFPIMGVNLGSVGFITEIDPAQMISSVEKALEGKLKEDLRNLFQVDICRGDVCRISGLVCNDAVITKDAKTAMLKFQVSVGEDILSLVRADGYIIATPTGSTAYAMSSGGPLLHPGVNGLVLVPMCPHSLSSRPIVIPSESTVKITPAEFKGAVYLVLDGQINYEIQEEDVIQVHRSKTFLRLLRSPHRNWSEALRVKLALS